MKQSLTASQARSEFWFYLWSGGLYAVGSVTLNVGLRMLHRINRTPVTGGN